MASIEIGDVVDGHYDVVEDIGAGGMGAVRKVRDNVTGAEFALKFCTFTDAEGRKRFNREVRVMESIHHAHVVDVIHHDTEHDPPYFLMPLAENSIADELVDTAAEENIALEVFLEICQGVQAIHNTGAYHRDLKPHNVLRMSDGRVVVSDLGLARFSDRDSTTLTQTHQMLGTTIYAAPEQFDSSRDADERTDVFQLGKTLYELLTNQIPAVMDFTSVSNGLVHILRRSTEQSPNDRYQSIGELIDAVNLYIASQDPMQNPRQTLETLLQEAEVMLQNNEYTEENLRSVLSVFNTAHISDENFIDLFDRIPMRLLPIMANNFTNDFRISLEAYRNALENEVSGYGFSYAETVGRRMSAIFVGTDNEQLRVVSLESVLIAAVYLNRFAAMGIFNNLLQDISAEEAIAVAEMLRRRAEVYKRVAGQVPRDSLPAPIQLVRDELID